MYVIGVDAAATLLCYKFWIPKLSGSSRKRTHAPLTTGLYEFDCHFFPMMVKNACGFRIFIPISLPKMCVYALCVYQEVNAQLNQKKKNASVKSIQILCVSMACTSEYQCERCWLIFFSQSLLSILVLFHLQIHSIASRSQWWNWKQKPFSMIYCYSIQNESWYTHIKILETQAHSFTSHRLVLVVWGW